MPTFNERANVPILVDLLHHALAGIGWEVIFVDDELGDGTAGVAPDIGAHDLRVRCIRRIGRRGLTGACLEGMLSSQAPFVAVMDADLQHPAECRDFNCGYLTHARADRNVETSAFQIGLGGRG